MNHEVRFLWKILQLCTEMSSHKCWVIVQQITPFLSSVYGNVRKYVSIPNCLSTASISYKNCFQYAGVPLTELINDNALFLATNISIASLKLILTVSFVSVFSGVVKDAGHI